MPVRLRSKIDIAISSTSTEERDLGNIRKEVVTDAFGEGGSRKILIVAGATDVQIPIDIIADVGFFSMITTPKNPNEDPESILIRLNSISADQITVAPLADTKVGFMSLSTAGMISLFASNPGAADIELTICLAGD